ncbi:aspartate aminotransferase family protein [Acuticoccus sp. MNP-M23]|uniref:aspartate aminotransferase family protein n=1 Tax=Acuticoccus sp. MNP-M23 TaxID=3072793 RepID=UPI002815CA02|nr:aspartate aminotransferase family protein [Acuticoccus sp. MNP-M23]WMS44200.1 aspartate aminotransferase family protein [Acuticoccus sp. MNP-M23]
MTEPALFATYNRIPVSFDSGEGVWLHGSDGRRYLDMGAGIAVSALGHQHPHLVAEMQKAVAGVWHTSNLFEIPEQARLGERLVAETFAERVFFCNSGAEANEAAIKTARRYQFINGHPERTRIITMAGAFHGRTLGTIAAGGSPKYLEGFGEPLAGFDQAPYDDIEAVKALIGPETAAIMVEPIQGEGGIRPVSREVLAEMRALCDEHGLLLVFDEVQTGAGRTGTLFAYQSLGVTPDILAAAKGIGGGFPLGACLATADAAAGMVPGTHGTTYGGNRLACVAGNAVLDVLLEDGFLEKVRQTGLYAKQALAGLVDSHPDIFETVRGEGLMIGVKCRAPVADITNAARAEGLLVIPAGENTARLLPPLVATEADIREAVAMLDRAATAVEAKSAAAPQ